MGRHFLAVLVASLALVLDPMGQGARANEYDHLIAKHAAAHGVPADLVRRVIQIETRGNPSLVSKGNYGLMQIRLGTARAMGYGGDAGGLLDADTNMTYAVRYLAGAYRAAGGNSEQAIRNYQRGYYGQAKAQGFSPYAVASAPPQAAAPDPTMLRQQQEIERRKVAEQQRQAMLSARVEQRKAAEQQRIAQRQAMVQERIDRQHALEQKRIEQRRGVEQKRIERRQAMPQQNFDREQAKQQQRIDLEQARQKPQMTLPPAADQPKVEAQRLPSAQPAAPPRRAATPGYAWYNPMRYFRHPSHQAHPLSR